MAWSLKTSSFCEQREASGTQTPVLPKLAKNHGQGLGTSPSFLVRQNRTSSIWPGCSRPLPRATREAVRFACSLSPLSSLLFPCSNVQTTVVTLTTAQQVHFRKHEGCGERISIGLTFGRVCLFYAHWVLENTYIGSSDSFTKLCAARECE